MNGVLGQEEELVNKMNQLNDLQGQNFVAMEDGMLTVNEEALNSKLGEENEYGQKAAANIWQPYANTIKSAHTEGFSASLRATNSYSTSLFTKVRSIISNVWSALGEAVKDATTGNWQGLSYYFQSAVSGVAGGTTIDAGDVTVTIETESKQRSDADAGIMALISQLAGNHTEDIEELKSADAALQDEIEENHLTLKGLIEEMGLNVDALSERTGIVETVVNELNERIGKLEESGGTSEEVVQRISSLETSVTTLEEEKLGKSEVVEVESDCINDVFNDVFGFGSLSMSGDNVTIVGSDVTIDSPIITLQTNPYGVQAYWLPGLRVDAPTDRSNDAVYQTMNEAISEWSEVKSFNEYKDGDDYIWLYARAEPEKLTFDQRWRFDWDSDGIYEQLVTIKVINAQLI